MESNSLPEDLIGWCAKDAAHLIDLSIAVSVSITCFNSEKWLGRALDSVLAQQVDFPIEIVIGDDCSQDSSLAIAHSYRERHPERIRVIEREKNLGIQRTHSRL
jgi:glycosyltransferase involved in cell wall biosynthesis